jgi:hypothetical protein
LKALGAQINPMGPAFDKDQQKDMLDRAEAKRKARADAAKEAQRERAELEAAEFAKENMLRKLDEDDERRQADKAEKKKQKEDALRQKLIDFGRSERAKFEEEKADEEKRGRKRFVEGDPEIQGLLGGGSSTEARTEAAKGQMQTLVKDFADGRIGVDALKYSLAGLRDELDALGQEAANQEALTAALQGLAGAAGQALWALTQGNVADIQKQFKAAIEGVGKEATVRALFEAAMIWADPSGAPRHIAAAKAFAVTAAVAGVASAALGGGGGGSGGGAAAPARAPSARESGGGSSGGSGRAQQSGPQGPSVVNYYIAGDVMDDVSFARKISRGLSRAAEQGVIPTVDVGGATAYRVGG